MNLEQYYAVFVVLQVIHSQEEIYTGFHNKWPVFSLSKKAFVAFELAFSLFIVSMFFIRALTFRDLWFYLFNLLMFANGVEHLIWAASVKKYVPGLISSFALTAFFLYYYLTFLAYGK